MEQLILLIDSDQRPTNPAEGIAGLCARCSTLRDNRDNSSAAYAARKTQRVDERYNETWKFSTVIMRECVYMYVRCGVAMSILFSVCSIRDCDISEYWTVERESVSPSLSLSLFFLSAK